MKRNSWKIIGIVVVVLLLWGGWTKFKNKATSDGQGNIIHPHVGDIQTTVSTTGTVLPKNRLEVKPPVNGRIEQVLVKEGQKVNAGDTIAVMSSTDRAALLDAARGQGEEKLKYWQEVYKPIALIAPINGEVIVGTIQPGQTVTTNDPVIVLSDHLIVRAQVDETDIGKIEQNQKAVIGLDAYPEARINASVEHIYYESKIVNNVTIYDVDLLPEAVPSYFRSGMNANVDFIQESKQGVLILPLNAVHKEQNRTFVMVKSNGSKKATQRTVTLGISDDKNAEIVFGLTKDDSVILRTKKYALPQSSGSSPLTPSHRR